ncbi:calcium-responsive transcription factor-like isoform X1 [Mya arenaria]|uniref:calcium-responsive transcription factor-like isoform X1 n=1 Tax=Mya arenaria TaxID=6604 RepID=UPI0022E4C51E|nr:calcium-responsive transcription factor-like isoform X1 [Mya arenaria]XP_052807196.1 calcium-responsive transcription factor-like isoform X1 [Mya arenaria]
MSERSVSIGDTLPGVLTIDASGILTLPSVELPDEDEGGITVSPATLLSSQAMLVSPTMSNQTLQSLLASPSALQSGAQFGLPEGIQIITVTNPSTLFQTPTLDASAPQIWQIINRDDTLIAVPTEATGGSGEDDSGQVTSTTDHLELTEPSTEDLASVLMPPPPQLLPIGCPSWAARLKNCERIGDYYRGYVDTEVEMDILLTYHKQATQSFWGTRQSPSPAKQSTRFMWKSQYVPFDGIPFVNTGSRAVVMECQFGPRRKGGLAKKVGDQDSSGEYRQTCPARIYIKKVRKFPEFKIDPNMDKRSAKVAMDKAFHKLKQHNLEKIGQDRYYIQLPTVAAHEFHEEIASRSGVTLMPQQFKSKESQTPEDIILETENAETDKKHRLHPMVIQKLREIVAGGEVRVYHVRRLLRMFVCRELMMTTGEGNINRHDLSLFPTITDLKNHIHQSVKDIESGSLALTASTVNVEPMSEMSEDDSLVQVNSFNIWPQAPGECESPMPETVTVTLTQGPGEDGEHVISRIETHMSDGSTQISTSLTPETAQILARLNPSLFPPGSLIQLKVSPDEVGEDVPASNVNLNSSSGLDNQESFTEMDMEVQDTEPSLTIIPKEEDTLTISALDASQIITSVSPSALVEQNDHVLI